MDNNLSVLVQPEQKIYGAQETKICFICPLANCAAYFRTQGPAEEHILGGHGLYEEPQVTVTCHTTAPKTIDKIQVW